MPWKPRGMIASGWVKEMRNRAHGWTDIVAEWIDNAVGNGATRVQVTWKPHFIEVRDNGVGCDQPKFCALVSPNWHQEDAEVRNRVSRYGIGAKEGFLWCGGPTECYSCRDGLYQTQTVEWDSFGDEWDYEDIIRGEQAEKRCRAIGLDASGVVIRQPHHTRQMNKKIFQDVRTALNKLFWAAVETNVEIELKLVPPGKKAKPIRALLESRAMPALMPEHSIDESVTLADGRLIAIRGGVLASGTRLSNPGFEYLYGHRVVIPAGGVGSGSLDFERVYFRVFLLGDKNEWQVTTNKTGLHDSDEAALNQAVFDHCKALLEVARSESYESVLDQEWLNEAGELLTAADRKHAKRSPKSGSGAVTPTGTGTEHKTAAAVHDRTGKYDHRGRRRPSSIQIRPVEFEEEDSHLIGRAVLRDRIVRLNTLHPFVESFMKRRDQTTRNTVVFSLWSDAWTATDDSGQGRIVKRGEFVAKLSTLLRASATAEAELTP